MMDANRIKHIALQMIDPSGGAWVAQVAGIAIATASSFVMPVKHFLLIIGALVIVAETGEHDDEIYLTTNGFLYRQTVTGDPWVASNVQQTDISDQLPYGDWRPGRWAWRLTDAEPVQSRPAPEVTRGNRQGVCEIKETW